MIQFYGYSKCSTCRNAKQYLDKRKIKSEEIDITLQPPSKSVLQQILKGGEYRIQDLFNKSGEMYRSLNMKEKMKKLSEPELLDLLAKNGKLVKRPVVTDGRKFTVGFKEDQFRQKWG